MAGGLKRVLVVDDEQSIQKSICRLFFSLDVEVVTASSGIEGIEILETMDRIDVIVSDFKMPGMDGVEFLREAKRKWPSIPRIMLTGYAHAREVAQGNEEGLFVEIIPKPWVSDQLLHAVFKVSQRSTLFGQCLIDYSQKNVVQVP